MHYPSLSVVIPCYKEAGVIEKNILTVNAYLKEKFERFEIIVVIDGSPDKTKENIERLRTKHTDIPLAIITFPKNRGKGAAVTAGILTSAYDPVLFIDADLTIPIQELDHFILALESADIAIASRLVPGSRFEEPTPWHRTLLARGFHLLQILILGNFEFSDTQCGFKLFRREAALKIFNKITVQRFAFDTEVLFLAAKYNFKITILPVTILKDPRNTNVAVFKDPFNMFFALLKIRLNNWSGKYRS